MARSNVVAPERIRQNSAAHGPGPNAETQQCLLELRERTSRAPLEDFAELVQADRTPHRADAADFAGKSYPVTINRGNA